jgi:hypothetical protein
LVTTPGDADLPDAPPLADTDVAATPRPEAPTSVVASYWILIASATLNLLIVVITVAAWNRIVNGLLPQPIPAGMTLAQARSRISANLIENLVLDVVFAGLYIVFAILVRRGRNWARLTITAIVAVFAVFVALGSSGRFTPITALVLLVGVGLLYTRPAKAFFVAAKAARPARR